MIEPDALLMFTTASALLAVAPGPDNIFVLTQSIVSGRAAGLKVTLGLCTGLVAHTTVVALGVSVIFMTSVLAFNVLKYMGAAYLACLSYMAFRASSHGIDTGGKTALSSWQLYRRGILMNVTNPKVSIFFMAFLPQFTSPSGGSITLQLVLLGLVFILVTLLVFGAISQLAGAIGQWISRSGKGEQWLNRTAGAVFALLAVKLVLTRQN